MHCAEESRGPHRLSPTRVRRLPRRGVLAAASGALAAPFLPRFARAAQFTWRIAHSAPSDFSLQLRLVEAAGTIATHSDGQMEVQVYPNSELGGPVGLLAQLRAGTIDAVPLTSQLLSSSLAVAALPMLGFAFAGYDRLWPAMDGDVGGFLRDQIKERLGLVAMDRCWDFGFRQITTGGKTIDTAGDMEGLRLRTVAEADFIALFQALKALPVAMPLSALEATLRSGSIQAQESVLPLVKGAGLFKVQSVCALTNHVWDGQWMCVSAKSWSKLPPKLQQVVAGALNESALNQRQDTMTADTKIRKELEATGMKFNAVDPESFRATLRKSGYYAAWRTKIGEAGWAALEKYAGRLT
ncbi:MAG: TRAP transporter substrate-binding protein [Rhodopila sp.]|nr:TRAP transporter substrate-binding protein [Rhodopila sp.]